MYKEETLYEPYKPKNFKPKNRKDESKGQNDIKKSLLTPATSMFQQKTKNVLKCKLKCKIVSTADIP